MKYIINENIHVALANVIKRGIESHLDGSTWICGIEVKPSDSLDNPELKFEVMIYLSKDEFGFPPSNVRNDINLSLKNVVKKYIARWFPFKDNEISVESRVVDC